MYDNDQVSFSLVSTTGVESCELSSSGSTSVAPSIFDHEHEHGRRYHSYISGRYPLPNDIGEQHREDMTHALMVELADGKLFLSDIGDCPQKIIDVGTGTGTWAIDVADLCPSASVFGTDLSPIQAKYLPTNVRMFVEDCEQQEWGHGSGFDLVHFRGVAGFLRDIDVVLATAYSHTKNGGWVEFQEFDPSILCDDGTMKDDDPVWMFSELCTQGIRRYGCVGFGKQNLRKSLQRAGFRRVQYVVKKVPISTWPRDKKMRAIGMFMKANMLESLEAFAAKPLVALGMSPEERKTLVDQVRKSLEDTGSHRYMNCCFCYGQKDELGSEAGSYL
ncbi:Fc.00g019470.m01.CDS01 [Cosmosporella sp. VM-42]